jgi:hypothetical protein
MSDRYWVRYIGEDVQVVRLEGPQIPGSVYYGSRDEAVNAAISHCEAMVSQAMSDLVRQKVALFKSQEMLVSARSLLKSQECIDNL